VFIFTFQSLYPGERALGVHWMGEWVGPRAGEVVKKLKKKYMDMVIYSGYTVTYILDIYQHRIRRTCI
jgi:hypothetical protein